MGQLDQEMASLLSQHQDAVQRLAEVPGLGVDSAQQIIAEVGATAATFPSAKNLVLVGGRMPRRRRERGSELQPPLSEGQPSHAAHSQSGCQRRGKVKGASSRLSIAAWYRASGTTNHRGNRPSALSLDLEDSAPGGRYEERGPAVARSRSKRTARMIRELRSLGYRVEQANSQSADVPA